MDGIEREKKTYIIEAEAGRRTLIKYLAMGSDRSRRNDDSIVD
jgi:hypothetical protein